MTPFASLLVPVDFGAASARAVRVAGTIAERAGGTIQALHAEPLEAPAYFTHEQLSALAAQRRHLRDAANAHLAAFVRQHTQASFTTVISQDSPVDAVRHHAASADLIVMGTHGRKGPSRWWLGSVAERVLWETDRPLLIVHAGDDSSPLCSQVAVYTAPSVAGDQAWMFGEQLAGLLAVPLIDRRQSSGVPAATAGTTLPVLSFPLPHDRAWQASIGERLVRESHGVMFVPERAATPRAEI